MKVGFGMAAAILALALTTVTPPAQACNDKGNCANATSRTRGAPGPVAGAGLPILAIGFGYGVFWLVRRRKKPTDS